MHPILFKIGAIQVYSYGAMLAAAFLTVALLARRRAAALGMDADAILDLCLWLIVSGLIGARLFFIILNLDYYRQNPAEIPMLWKGGLVWYGGLIAAIAAGIIYLKIKKMPLLKTGDLMMPYVALGQAIGRIGCFLNGCCYGKAAPPGFGVTFDAAQGSVYPTQLYESAAMFIVFLILRRRTPKDGGTLFLYLMFYSALRFCIEYIRGDNPFILMGLTVSQLISIAVFMTAVILWRSIPSK